MPELPEVRTVSKYLREQLINKDIKDFDLLTSKALHENETIQLKEELIGQKILDIKTHGKYIIFELSDYYLVIHLRMEGKVNFSKEFPKFELNHSIFLMKLDDLYFNFTDHRKFATIDIYLKDNKKISDLNVLRNVAKEPWDINLGELFEKVKKKNSPIKVTLLDQNVIAGLGNIYVDEVLYKSKIHPLQKTNLITKEKWGEILENSKEILEEAIEMGGSTIKTYSAAGHAGSYQNKLIVHQSFNKYCKNCGEKIKIIKVGGRGTYYCPGEQKLWE